MFWKHKYRRGIRITSLVANYTTLTFVVGLIAIVKFQKIVQRGSLNIEEEGLNKEIVIDEERIKMINIVS